MAWIFTYYFKTRYTFISSDVADIIVLFAFITLPQFESPSTWAYELDVQMMFIEVHDETVVCEEFFIFTGYCLAFVWWNYLMIHMFVQEMLRPCIMVSKGLAAPEERAGVPFFNGMRVQKLVS